MALSPDYGVRIGQYARDRYPTAFEPAPTAGGIGPGMGPPQAQEPPSGPKGFPKLVLDTQGEGPKLDADTVNALKERYITEVLRPRLANAKGSKELSVEAGEAAFQSKAQRWIEEYLRDAEAANTPIPETGNPVELSRVPGALWDTAARAVQGTVVDLPAGVAGLADYGIRKLTGSDSPTALGRFAQSYGEGGREFFDQNFITEETLAAERGLSELMSRDASAGEIAAYVASNSSVAGSMIGGFLGLGGPLAKGVGMAGKAAAAGSMGGKIQRAAEAQARLAQRLEKGGRVSRAAGRAVQQAPVIGATGLVYTGDALNDYRASIMELPVTDLLDSDINKAYWDSLEDLGLTGAERERAFKEGIIGRTEDTIAAGSLAANALIPGVFGSPLEAMLGRVGAQPAGNALRRFVRGAVAEGGQEALAALPETAAGNIAMADATGQEIPVMRGAGANAALGAGLGAVAGGSVAALQRPRPQPNPLIRQLPPPSADSPNFGTVPTTPPAQPAAAPPATPAATAPVAPQAAPSANLNSITQNPGAGIEEAALETLTAKIKSTTKKQSARATTKAALGKLDAPALVQRAATEAQKIAGDTWTTLSAEQRITATETALESLRAHNKAEGVGDALTQLRAQLTQPTVTPPGPTTPATPEIELPPATPTPEPTPATPAPTTPTPEPTPATPVAPVNMAAQLPSALRGAKPRYGNGTAQYEPRFESDIDKALYIAANPTKKSPRDAEYRKWLVEQGIPENQIDALGQLVRQAVAAQMGQHKGGSSIAPARVPMPATNILENVRPEPTPEPPAPTTPAPKKAPAKKAPAKKAAKKNPLKKDTPSPKQEAPAATSEPGQPTQQAAPTNTQERETAEAAVRRITRTDLEPSEVAELAAAIDLAREGDGNALTTLIRELQISKRQAAQLREAAKPLTPAEQGLTVTEEPAETAMEPQPWDEGADDSLVWTRHDPTIEAAFTEAAKMRDDGKNRTRTILTAVLNAKSSTRPQKWLAQKLLDITKDIEVPWVRGKNLEENHFAYGAGNPRVVTYSANPEVVLHEYVHAVTATMIFYEVADPRVKKLQADLDAIRDHIRNVVKTDPAFKKLDSATRGRIMYGLSNVRELVSHALTNPEMQGYLRELPALDKTRGSSAWEEFRNLLKNFWANLTGAKGANRTLLDDLIDRTTNLIDFVAEDPRRIEMQNKRISSSARKRDFNMRASDAAAPVDKAGNPDADGMAVEFRDGMGLTPTNQKPKAGVDARTVSRASRLIEQLAQAAYGIEESVRAVIKAGGNVVAANNPYLAYRRYSSDIAENRTTDIREVVEPVRDWITANWNGGKFIVSSVEDFRKQLDKFLQAYHSLNERNPTVWAETVPLKGDAEVDRAEIMDDAFEGKLTPEQVETRLRELAEKHATQTLEEWASESPNGINPEAAQEVLDDVAKRGFTVENLEELNTLLENVRTREHSRRVQAGIVAENDPFARRPSWKWYVPLKDDSQVSFNLGMTSRLTAKEFADRNLGTIKGRQTQAANALESLIMDLNSASAEHAEYNFKSVLYEYVLDNQELLGATIREVTGTPKAGYTYETWVRNKKTGKRRKATRHSRRLPNPSHGFVYSNGDTHFIVNLPQGSRLDAGIKGIRNALSPQTLMEREGAVGSVFRGAGVATNVMARSYTTWAPDWQLMVGFVRDLQTLPVTIGIDQFKNPWEARAFFTRYMRNLVGNTMALPALKAEISAVIRDNKADLRKLGEADPSSYVGKLLRYRNAGGSTEFAQGLNRERADDILFGDAKRDADGLLSLGTAKAGYDKLNQLTSDWAALLENKGRVAAFEAMAEVIAQRDHNTSWAQLDPDTQLAVDREAAAIAKGAMDYGQSGEWGKLINAWHAFYRVGATQVDVIRRIFTKPDGGLDMEKVKGWTPFFAMMGAVNYMLVAALLGDDEEGEARINKISPTTLTKKMVFPGPDGNAFGVSIGLGLPQLLLAPGTLGAAYANGHISAAEAADAYYDVLTSSNLPISPAGWEKGTGARGFATSWIRGITTPTVVDPLVETVDNLNAFDRPIHTNWPQKDKFKSDSAMPNTPPQWTEMATWLRETTGIDMFPEDIRHLTNGYAGQVPKTIQRWTMDKAAQEESEGVASSAITRAARAEVRDEQFYYRNEARQAQSELQVSQRLMQSAAGKDKLAQASWKRENPDHARRIQAQNDLNKALDAYYKRRNEIRANSLMSPKGKQDQNKLADSKLREAVNRAQRIIEETE